MDVATSDVKMSYNSAGSNHYHIWLEDVDNDGVKRSYNFEPQ